MLEILKIGGYATIQDKGRIGTRRFGIPAGGFMDVYSAHLANQLVGNDPDIPLMEIFNGVIEFKCQVAQLFSFTGAHASIRVGEKYYKTPCLIRIEKSQIISIWKFTLGHILYVAVKNGIITNQEFGSVSTYVQTRIGGHSGRSVRKGDKLLLEEYVVIKESREIVRERHYASAISVRFKKGPEYDLMFDESKKGLVSDSFGLRHTNRVGYRLHGPRLHVSSNQLSSRFVTRGTIQLPPDGDPIVLLSDAQTTGGYARIAQVFEEDLDYLAQMSAGSRIRFKEIL
jgi:biotin-dependent carboxylase-like uncharacterized protein